MVEPRAMERLPIVGDLDPAHLIGIGGAGMSAIAKVLLSRGVRVSGSDMKDSPALAALTALGAEIVVGHAAGNLPDGATVIVSSAIRANNPELVAARDVGSLVLHRAQVLAILMRERRGIAISGTHGKTTTTSMIALVMQRAGLDPGFLVGGDLNERGTNAHAGGGAWLVAEADESDGSFLWLAPEIAVVTNIEADHLDHYRDEREVRDTFLAFMRNVPDHGAVVACIDDAGVRAVLPMVDRTIITYGSYGLGSADWTVARTPTDRGQILLVHNRDDAVVSFELPAPGAHNALNALAAIATADAAGVPFEQAASALAAYAGVRRRFELRGIAGGVTVIDDYAHNPSKVRAAISAAREQARARVVAVFQPHLYSRTQHLGHQLGAALSGADLVVVTDVYGAREDPQPGVTGKLVVEGLLDESPRARVAYLPKRTEIPAYIAQRVRSGDLVMTIGAGDITMLGPEILRALGSRPGER